MWHLHKHTRVVQKLIVSGLFDKKQYALSYFVLFDLGHYFINFAELTELHFCDPVYRVTTRNPLLTDLNLEKR